MAEAFQERQEEELNALIAIFDHDVVDLRQKKAWKTWKPLHVAILLRPSQGLSATEGETRCDVTVVLDVSCPPTYPSVIPQIQLRDEKGVSKEDLALLQQQLKNLAHSLKGEVMIMDLALHVQNFLHSHSRPKMLSFHEEMLKMRKMSEAASIQRQRTAEAEEAKAIELQITKKQAELQLEAKLRLEQQTYESESDYEEGVNNGHRNRSSSVPPVNVLPAKVLKKSSVVMQNKQTRSPSKEVQLPRDLVRFLSQCLTKGDYDQKTIRKLLAHPLLKAEKLVASKDADENGIPNRQVETEFSRKVEDMDERVPVPVTSRLKNEFQILEWLGRGGYGDVLKVQNQLDGGIYAIKRILLDPKSRHFNKRITREVKLLSRLNHENVVRYYNSWIETTVDVSEKPNLSSTATGDDLGEIPQLTTPETNPRITVSTPDKAKVGNAKVAGQKIVNLTLKKDPFAEESEEEIVAEPVELESVEWSVSGLLGGDVRMQRSDSTSSFDDEDNEEDVAILSDTKFIHQIPAKEESFSSSDAIIFDQADAEGGKVAEQSGYSKGDLSKRKSISSDEPHTIQILYIQMEFCEKSTLRQLIDSDELYSDPRRSWRLFTELLEGLNHIHEQGMIHRDLKPGNIFLDFGCHIKIGDFGLATQSGGILDKEVLDFAASAKDPSLNSSQLGDLLTGKVGTALYVSPELCQTGNQITYTQKVDIYSLGIVFFEMFHPLGTGMERIKILTDLRKPEIVMPVEFKQSAVKCNLARKLLNHNPDERPTARQILESDWIPPQAMELDSFQVALSEALENPQTRKYKFTIGAMFNQQTTVVEDKIFDEVFFSHGFNIWESLCHEFVRDQLVEIFSRHGAVRISPPTLLPQNKILLENTDKMARFKPVKLMDQFGQVVTLPYDLRFSFARFVARSGIVMRKRFAIEKVYRSKDVGHPKEITECAFDIVTRSAAGFTAAAETLGVIGEVINSFEVLKERRYVIKINHTSLLAAVLYYVGIDDLELQRKVLAIVGDVKGEQLHRKQMEAKLKGLGITEKSLATLFQLISAEGSVKRVASAFLSLTKRKGERAATLAKDALKELELICSYVEYLDIHVPVVVSVSLIHKLYEYSGPIWRAVADVKTSEEDCKEDEKGKSRLPDWLADGGRYDQLIKSFKVKTSLETQPPPVAVGIRFNFDYIVSLLLKQQKKLSKNSSFSSVPHQLLSYCDVLICSEANRPMVKEILTLVKSLWALSMRADYIVEPIAHLDDILAECDASGVPHLVVLKESELGTAVVCSFQSGNTPFTSERFTQTKMSLTEVASYLHDYQQGNGSEVGVTSREHLNARVIHPSGSNTDSNVNWVLANVKIVCFSSLEKFESKMRKRYEAQIAQNIAQTVQRFSAKETIEVIGCDLPGGVIKCISGLIDLHDEMTFRNSVAEVLKQFPKFKKMLSIVLDHLSDVKFEQKCHVVIVYSWVDDCFRVIL